MYFSVTQGGDWISHGIFAMVVDWYSKTYILSGGSLDALLRPLNISKSQAI